MRILIIRTIQAELIGGLIDKWKTKFPNSTFDILTHTGQPNISNKVSNIIKYNVKSDFSWNGLNKYERKALKGYDVIIFPHKWKSIKGFHEVIELAIKLKPSSVYHSDKQGNLFKINKLMLLWVVIRKILVAVSFIILLPLFTILLLRISK